MINPIIYTITVIDVYTDKVIGVRRTPAIYTELYLAKSAVRNNTKDLADKGQYQYAVIEETVVNVIRPCDVITPTHWWFKYNSATDEFEECKVPNGFLYQCGFGVG
tara:strand:- start:565 stop:882 length:318 start_codon:yes stop_codon:yes gene_type:complete